MNSTLKNILLGAGAVAGAIGVGVVAVKAEQARIEALTEELDQVKDDDEASAAFASYLKAVYADDARKRSVYADDALEELRHARCAYRYPVLSAVLEDWAKAEESVSDPTPMSLPSTSRRGHDALAALQCSDCFRDRHLAEALVKGDDYGVKNRAGKSTDKVNARAAVAAYNRGEFS